MLWGQSNQDLFGTAESQEIGIPENKITKVSYFDASADKLFVIARSSTCWLY